VSVGQHFTDVEVCFFFPIFFSPMLFFFFLFFFFFDSVFFFPTYVLAPPCAVLDRSE